MSADGLGAVDHALRALDDIPSIHRIRLAGIPFGVHSDDEECSRLVVERFGHLLDDHSVLMGALRLRMRSTEIPELQFSPGITRLPDGGIVLYEPGVQVQVHRPGMGIDFLVSPATWIDVELASYPLATAIAAWASDREFWPVHAAAVDFDGRGILLVGESGAGKSTTAIACALEGAGLLGDDLCLVDPSGREIHSWYGTVKVHDDSARALGAQAWERLGVNPMGKSVIAASRVPSIRLQASAPLELVVVLRPVASIGGERSRLRDSNAVSALRPTALPVPNGIGSWLRHASSIARSVPVIEIPVDRPPIEMARVLSTELGRRED